uniref:Myozenin 3 n=1 Tax=Spermophilus dauricus TaxID=99837 RepID=A0A8C9UKA6_SPEDA
GQPQQKQGPKQLIPTLDLGKKLSVPQDLMIEELSLRNNPGSLLFQKRQRRVQRFTFELEESQRAILAGSAKRRVTGTAEAGMVSAEAGMVSAEGDPREGHSPGARFFTSRGAPTAASPAGYAEPLKGVPPERFNHTAIPKGYRCPWQEFISYRDYLSDGPSYTPNLRDYRNFNKTPVPFGGPLMGETIPRAGTPFVSEPFSGLELLRLRPSFNRVAQGWVRNLPESEEL